MASNLLYLKSKKLLPRQETEEEMLSEEELIQRIIEYKQYKEITNKFRELYSSNNKRAFRIKEDIEIPKITEFDVKYTKEDISNAYQKILKQNANKINKERLERIISGKIGKVLRLKASDIEKADKWFDTKGQKTVFICRFIPIVRSLISIPAGMSEMKFLKFLLYTVLGSTIWNTVLVLLGKQLGDSWERVVEVFSNFSHIILVVLIVLFILGVYWFYRNKIKKNIKSKPKSHADKVQVTFHTLRHTFATRAIEQGMEIPVLSKILGHADISTTLNKYCHAIPDRKRENMEKIQCLYEDSLESKI